MFRTKTTEECMDLGDLIMNPQYKENPMKHTNNDSTDTTYSRITYIMTNTILNIYFSNLQNIIKQQYQELQ